MVFLVKILFKLNERPFEKYWLYDNKPSKLVLIVTIWNSIMHKHEKDLSLMKKNRLFTNYPSGKYTKFKLPTFCLSKSKWPSWRT